jgi:hypothetical protein
MVDVSYLKSLFTVGRLLSLSTLQCLRKRDGHFSLKIPQLGQADTPIDDAIAVRANRYQVSHLLGNRLIIRHVTRGRFRGATSDAIDFTGSTSPFVFRPESLKECGKITAQNQHRPFAIAGWKPSLDPCPHCIFVIAKQTGDFLYGVATVDFDKAMVGAALSHDGYAPSSSSAFSLDAGTLIPSRE